MGALAIREGYGRGLAEYGLVNPNVVVLDADTSGSTFSSFFAERFPNRFYNIGIAEPCMVDVAVGLALGGAVPFVNAFAAILSLTAMERIRTCVCYTRTNVKLASSYAGLSDFKDGPSASRHHRHRADACAAGDDGDRARRWPRRPAGCRSSPSTTGRCICA